MDDLQLIRELLDAPPPTPPATIRARNRLAAAIADPGPARSARSARSLSRSVRSLSRSLRWSMAGAAALAGVAAIVLATATVPPDRTAPPGTDGGARAELSAPDILRAAASRAASAETGRYWRVQSIGVTGPHPVSTGRTRYELVHRSVEEQWIARDPGDQSWSGYRDLGYRPRTEADQQAWLAAGAPKYWDVPDDSGAGSTRWYMNAGRAELRRGETTSNLLGIEGFGVAQVQQLPTDPERLRALLLERFAADPGALRQYRERYEARLFGTLTQLLLDVPAPPKVRAAAFTVLAGIDGVRTIGEVTDEEGRTGMGIELTRTFDDYVEYHRLILDRTTYVILARKDYSGYRAGRPVKEQNRVILKAEWTDEQPVPPVVT